MAARVAAGEKFSSAVAGRPATVRAAGSVSPASRSASRRPTARPDIAPRGSFVAHALHRWLRAILAGRITMTTTNRLALALALALGTTAVGCSSAADSSMNGGGDDDTSGGDPSGGGD